MTNRQLFSKRQQQAIYTICCPFPESPRTGFAGIIVFLDIQQHVIDSFGGVLRVGSSDADAFDLHSSVLNQRRFFPVAPSSLHMKLYSSF